MIKLQIIGNIGKDAIVNEVNGKRVINFNVAHSEKFKDQSGVEVTKTIWVQCSYWSDKTGVVQYLTQGTKLYVEGQPDVKQYRANDGSNRANITLRVQSIQLLGSKQSDNTVSRNTNPPIAAEERYTPMGTFQQPEDEELPF